MTSQRKLKKCLHAAYADLDSSLKIWQTRFDKLEVKLKSIENLCEQAADCFTVDVTRTALNKFPDLKTNLLHKISLDIAKSLKLLSEDIKEHEYAAASFSECKQHVYTMYKQLGVSPGIYATIERTPIFPSLADLLEGLGDIERLLCHQLAAKKYVFENICYQEEDSVVALRKCWEADGNVIREIKGYLLYIRHFLQTTQTDD